MKTGFQHTLQKIFPVTLLRLILIFFLYQISRLGFYLFNMSLFQDVSFAQVLYYLKVGFIFDTTAIIYTNLLFIVSSLLPFPFRYNKGYQLYLKVVFILFNSLALAANVSDFIYYRFTLRRTTADVFDFMGHESNMLKLWSRFVVDYWPATVFFVALVYVLFLGWRFIRVSSEKPQLSFKYVGISSLVLLGSLTLMVGGVRGGFRHSTRPITMSNAGKYIDKPAHASIVLNTPFAMIRTLDKPALKPLNYYEAQELTSIYNPVHAGAKADFKPMNVVVFVLESFTRELVGALNHDIEGYHGYTPFLDSLISQSVVFTRAYANGGKSIDAIPAVIAGIPSMSLPYVLTPYSNNTINSMASCLNKENYETAFFHGAPNGSMGFDSFCKLAGFKHYYGLNEVNDPSQYDGIWGIWDEPMFQFMKNTLDQFDAPFLSVLFSLSSHHPFKVPEQYKGVFPKGPLPVYECAGYTDHSLRLFFERAKKSDWFDNTLFVISADHSTNPYHAIYNNSAGAFSIPILMYMPKVLTPQRIDKVVQQTDIFPTVLKMMNYPSDFLAFGNDMLQDSGKHFAINYYGNSFQVIEDDYLLQVAEDKPVGMYNLIRDREMKQNLLGTDPEQEKRMHRMLKAYRQNYNNRLINNEMLP